MPPSFNSNYSGHIKEGFRMEQIAKPHCGAGWIACLTVAGTLLCLPWSLSDYWSAGVMPSAG
ncbi:hypothetical protein DMH27_01685 [Raoultella planticola]|uniref:Uncharacterized protein n=1 Tax=Raoultella planticola TaxID=575 RepID=A0A5P6AAA1_RAOPL|nr:hypothetical protein [Raoultella planticola]QFG76751.1 hypothetical protein DMB90_12355 [Raoultella planticola]